MKRLMLLLLIIVPCFLSRPGWCAGNVLAQWDFAAASDTLGWTSAESLDRFACEDGALVAEPGPGRIKLQSPLFDIPAVPWQYVEIDLGTDADGDAIMYYSNTTEEPYHGFRPGQFVRFAVRGGAEHRTYRVFPLWQKHGRMAHIRIDPPGSRVFIRSVRIVDAAPEPHAGAASWDFAESAAGWSILSSTGSSRVVDGRCRVEGGADTIFLSPPVKIEADDNLWVTLRLSSTSARTAQFRWAANGADGLNSVPVFLDGSSRVRSYSLDMSDVPEWSGKVLAVGVTPSDTEEIGSIDIESISVSSAPSGPAQLEIRRFGLQQPFVRAGQDATLVVEIRNTGGAAARTVSASVGLLAGESPASAPIELPARRVDVIAAGETARFEWRFAAPDAGLYTAECSATADGADGVERTAALRFHPLLLLEHTPSYVPEPKPADTSPYMVGAYYYPGWHTYDRWSVLDDYPERRPVLGYYREGHPEVADWHILWALEHGISFFIYDWYWDEGKRQLEHALHDGFFNSRYQDRMKFCLLWANHNPPAESPEQDMLDVTRHWIEHYFSRPNYLKLGGKNVMVIFSTHRLSQDLGEDGVRKSFDAMRRMCEEAGVGGLYLIGCTYPGDDVVRRLEREGYDALSGYNYPPAGDRGRLHAPYEWMVEGYLDYWRRIDAAAAVPYIPVCEPGWDSRPWHGHRARVRTDKTPELWRRMLENARMFVDAPDRALPEGLRVVFLEAWNEFGEGDYIEPHAEFGFDHVEAVRAVFAPSSPKPRNIVPRDIGLGPYDIPAPQPRAFWDFGRPEDHDWSVGNMTGLSFEGGVMSAVALNHDPAFYSPLLRLNASEYGTVEIRMKTDGGDEAQLFFTRARVPMSEERSVRFPIAADNRFHTYTLDLRSHPRWTGVIGQIRLDPNGVAGSRVEIAHVRFR